VRRLAGLCGALLVLATVTAAIADGYSLGPYHYVHPPYWQRLTNVYPSSTIQTMPLHTGRYYYAIVAPSDAQVAISFTGPTETLAPPPGQKSVRVSVRPLNIRHLPHQGKFTVDGNVYAIGMQFLPSHQTVTKTKGDLLIRLDAPHRTPENRVEGRFGGRWQIICQAPFIDVEALPACLTKRIPDRMAVFYDAVSHSGSGHKTKAAKSSAAPSPYIVVAIAIVVLWVGLLLFLLVRGRPRRATRR
jgi:hypothetical protein